MYLRKPGDNMIRKRKNKFPLVFKDNAQIQTMEELRKNFDFKKVMEYFKTRKLAVWLEDRFYSDEADAIKALKPTDSNVPQKICEALGVDYSDHAEELDDAETVEWRAKRRERLRKFTDDENIIKKVDYVAFDQEDLEDIMRDPFLPDTIYLCDNFFKFPSGILRKTNIVYIGLGNVFGKIESQKVIDFRELNITFKNIRFVSDESDIEKYLQADKVAEENKTASEEKKIPVAVPRFSDTQMVMADFVPSAAITQTALHYKSKVFIRIDGKLYDAKSLNILKIRGLTKGSSVTVSAEGFDAAEVIKGFSELLKKGWQRRG